MNYTKGKTDEWYTPLSGVEPIIKYLEEKGFNNIWCPFDTNDSNFVQLLTNKEFNVVNTHIEYGQDFFETDVPEGTQAIVSNPPYSIRQNILERLYDLNLPFAMLMNPSGLFDSKKRFDFFDKGGVELMYLYPRVNFINGNGEDKASPNFQSAYVCRNVLPSQIVLEKQNLNLNK